MSCQQDELYAAEVGVTRGREFDRPEEAEAFLAGLRDLEFWPRVYPHVKHVEVAWVPGPSSVGGYDETRHAGRVDMGPAHRCELFLVHELAHVLADARYGSHSHDPWFCRTYLELVYHVMGPDVYMELYEGMEREGVDHEVEAVTS